MGWNWSWRDRGWRWSRRSGGSRGEIPPDSQPGIVGNGWLDAGIVFLILGLAILLVVAIHFVGAWSRERLRAQRQRRQEAQKAVIEEAVTKALGLAHQDRAGRQRAAELEQDKRWRAVPQMGHPAPPWGSESVIIWLHVPHNDRYSDHVGEAFTCEVWRSAYAYKSRQTIRIRGRTRMLPCGFPSRLEEPQDPWKENLAYRASPGGRRDGEYVVVWRNSASGEAVATCSFWFRLRRYELFPTGDQPTGTGWNSGMEIPSS